MTGYVRKDTTNNIADGNVINAADLDSEFDGVQAAFNSSTGHTHDGTASEGAPITKLGPVQDVTVSTTVLGVKTTNTVDLGTSSLKFKDFYLAGAASIGGTLGVTGATTLSAALTYGGVTLSNAVTGTGNMVLSASPTITGTITAAAANFSGAVALNGNATIGDADTDTITQVASYVTGTQLKSAKTATNTLSLAAYDVDGTAYTNLITLTASNTPTLALTSTGVGTINNMSIGATTASTGAFTTLTSNGATTFTAGTASTTTGTGTLVITGGLGVSGRINAANFDGVVGANTAAAGSFTTLTTSSTVTHNDGTANGVSYLNGSKVLTTGSALVFDGQTLTNTRDTPILNLNDTAASNVALRMLSTGGIVYIQSGVSGGAFSPIAFTANGGSSEQMRLTSTGLTTQKDATIYGVTVGRGAGAVSTNTAVGASALAGSNSGTGGNTALGYGSLQSNSTGPNNTAVGNLSGYSNTTGGSNTSLGGDSLYLNTTGNNNVALGRIALYSNTTGSSNVAIGRDALQANTTASRNTAIGYQAGYSNATGPYNIFVGHKAGYSATTGGNMFIGDSAGYSCTTGDANTIIGTISSAGINPAGYSLTTGSFNSFIGGASGNSNTTGSYNVALGNYSLNSNTTASNNTAVGYQAGYSNTTNGNQTLIGYTAGYNSTSVDNTIVGSQAGYSTTSAGNTFIGQGSGYYVSTGAKNTIVGRYTGNQGGLDIRTASNYIVLSDGDGNINAWCNPANGKTWVFGNSAVTQNPNEPVEVNGYGATTQYCYFASATVNTYSGYAMRMWSKSNSSVVGSITFNTTSTTYNTSSDYRLKDITGPISGDQAKDFVMALQPKQGTWKTNGSPFAGFVAHEFAEVSPSSVVGEKDAVDENGNPVMQAMQASSPEVMANLVALVQKIVTDNEQLKAEVDSLKAQINGASA